MYKMGNIPFKRPLVIRILYIWEMLKINNQYPYHYYDYFTIYQKKKKKHLQNIRRKRKLPSDDKNLKQISLS